MARVPITEFGVIQKLLAGATVQVFSANANGENTGTLATLYQAATGSGVVSNPQTLDEDGKLAVDCYVDGIVVAEISNISDLADRSLKKLRANPTQFPLGATNAAFEGANVAGFVDDAEAAATQAGEYLGLIEDTFQGIPSTSSLSISSGSKTFTVAAGLPFGAGQYIIATSDANPTTHSMNGQVTAYSGTSLTITVDAFLGSGSRADWTIRNSGPRGATGATGSSGSGSGDMLKSENLSGLANYTTARGNLGLGSAALSSVGDFATAVQGGKADTALQPADAVIRDRAYDEYGTNENLTSAIPDDDTIPQITEGTEILSASITPKTITNKIRVLVNLADGCCASIGKYLITAVFLNGGANAIFAKAVGMPDNQERAQVSIVFENVPASTSEQTYTVRVGTHDGSTFRLNGFSSGRRLGGVQKCTLILEEITE